MESSVETTLAALDLQEADAAAVELARAYARDLDAGKAKFSTTGPALLDVLSSLLATPRARAQAIKGQPPASTGKPNPLDELRDRRARRGTG